MEMWTESQRKARPPISKLRRLAIAARIITLISLAIALGIMKTNRPTGKDSIFIDYKKISSYKYMVATVVAGLAYTLLQTPFAAYYAIRGKRLINHLFFLHFEFYGDKVILCILATGVGASFGATTDLKNLLTSKHDQDLLDEFFNMAYVSAGFLFIGFISSAYSSVLSSSATLPPEE